MLEIIISKTERYLLTHGDFLEIVIFTKFNEVCLIFLEMTLIIFVITK